MNARASKSNWTDWHIAEMRRRAASGQSAGQVAVSFNFSRNSVLGKAHRLGIQFDSLGDAEQRKLRAKKTPVTIMNLKEGVCRYPIGDPHDDNFGYCGAHAPDGSPYCCEHRLVCYTGKAFPSSGRPFRLSPIGIPRIVYEVAE